MSRPPEVLIAEPMGFCEGVVAADDLLRNVTLAAQAAGIEQIYGYHEIVHNTSVSTDHEGRGVTFVKLPNEVPDKNIVVTSAHGTSPEVIDTFLKKDCLVFDAACPLVIHTHKAVQEARRDGEHVIYVIKQQPSGYHDEVLGILGHLEMTFEDGELVRDPVPFTLVDIGDDPETVAAALIGLSDKFRIVTQTTLDDQQAVAFRERLEDYLVQAQPSAGINYLERTDVCMAVRRRLEGVRVMIRTMQTQSEHGDIVVVTDRKSKNGMGYAHLAEEIIEEQGLDSYRVIVTPTSEGLPADVGAEGRMVGITASASTPDRDILGVLGRLGANEATLPERKTFHLRHSDGRDYWRPGVIDEIINEWKATVAA